MSPFKCLGLLRYKHHKEWAKKKETNQSNEAIEFHDLFLNEFVRENVEIIERSGEVLQYCRINVMDEIAFESDRIDEEGNKEITKTERLLKTPNNPFSFKIKKLPSTYLNEKVVLMYEEVINLLF